MARRLVLSICIFFGCNSQIDRFEEHLLGLQSLSYRLVVVEDGVYPDGQRIKEPWTIADVQVTQDINESNWVGELLHGCVTTSESSWIGPGNTPPMIAAMRRAKFLGRENDLYKYSLVYGNDELTIRHTYWLGDYLMKWGTTQQSNMAEDTGRVTRIRTYSNFQGVKK